MAKVQKKTIARALGVSPGMVSKYLAAGMPHTTIEDARRWKDQNVRPRYTAGSAPVAPTPTAGPAMDADALADVIVGAGEAMAAALMVECGLPANKVSVAINTFAFVLSDALGVRGDPENNLFMIGGPDMRDPAVRARVEARAAALRAELAESAPGQPDEEPTA